MPTQLTPSAQDAVATYSANQVEGATPGQLMLQTYDYVIACCRRKDMVQAKKGLVELMGSLNLDQTDVAGPLFRVYEYCLDVVREGKFDEALGYLSELREVWADVVDKVESGAGALEHETAEP